MCLHARSIQYTKHAKISLVGPAYGSKGSLTVRIQVPQPLVLSVGPLSLYVCWYLRPKTHNLGTRTSSGKKQAEPHAGLSRHVKPEEPTSCVVGRDTLGLQKAQRRLCLSTLGPNVGTICILWSPKERVQGFRVASSQ